MKNAEDLINSVTKPYICEGLAALGLDTIAGLILYLIIGVAAHDFLVSFYVFVPIALIALIFDIPLPVKCFVDRHRKEIDDVTCTILYLDSDTSYSNKWRLRNQPESVLTTWYYPRQWQMERFRLKLKTSDGKIIKPRVVMPLGRGSGEVVSNVASLQHRYGDQMKFRVRYCKYSKALLSIEMISSPPDMKRRTKEYIDSGLGSILSRMIGN